MRNRSERPQSLAREGFAFVRGLLRERRCGRWTRCADAPLLAESYKRRSGVHSPKFSGTSAVKSDRRCLVMGVWERRRRKPTFALSSVSCSSSQITTRRASTCDKDKYSSAPVTAYGIRTGCRHKPDRDPVSARGTARSATMVETSRRPAQLVAAAYRPCMRRPHADTGSGRGTKHAGRDSTRSSRGRMQFGSACRNQ